MNRIRTAALLIAALALVISVSACGGSASGSKPQAQNTPSTQTLDGTWKNDDPNLHMSAIVSNGTIQISFESTDVSALYWKGTFPASATHGDDIVSQGDRAEMDASMMGSSEDVKHFYYASETISYKLTVMGVTRTVSLKKVK